MPGTRLCPIKESNVFLSTCKKCSYTKDQCNAAELKRLESKRHCIECEHDEDESVCNRCGDESVRERPKWEPAKPKPEATKIPEQMSLFD